MQKIVWFLILFFLITACSHKEQKHHGTDGPMVVEAIGFTVPKDSMAEPMVIPVDESKLAKSVEKADEIARNGDFLLGSSMEFVDVEIMWKVEDLKE